MEVDQPEAVTGEVAGGLRSEPGGRAQRPAGGAPTRELPGEVRDRLWDGVIDRLLAGARMEEEIVGPGGLLADLTGRLVERALYAELTEHLGYEPHQEPPGGIGNTREWLDREDACYRARAGRDEDAQGSQEQL